MQFKLKTGQAIRVILELARYKKRTSVQLADLLSMEATSITVILQSLKKANLIKVSQGMFGGYSLNKNPEDITMLDVIKVTEPTIHINLCLDQGMCLRNKNDKCPVREVYVQVQERMEEEFKKYTIAELAKAYGV